MQSVLSSALRIAVLGSTGSVGTQALDVIRSAGGKFEVASLVANSNIDLLEQQVREFNPKYVAVADEQAAATLRSRLTADIEIGAGPEAVETAAVLDCVDVCLAAIVGFAGLPSVLAAIAANKHIALANKEALVAGGSLVRRSLQSSRSVLIPVDSEHSSIYQCLDATRAPKKITLIASGGPFLNTPLAELEQVSPSAAVRHPRWSMGAKISVDSATLMNKGLEVIEAAELFALGADQIDVLVHPQTVIHGLVEYYDGSVLACLFENDMRVPIGYAFDCAFRLLRDGPSSPSRHTVATLDLVTRGPLEFFAPDLQRFPALALCYQALRSGDGATIVLNASNEVAVSSFMREELGFTEIAAVVQSVLGAHTPKIIESIEDIRGLDAWARQQASKAIVDRAR